jgi:anaerobic selenocysteine-containing dehydrogenase
MPRTVHTYCRICEAACGLAVEVDDDQRVTAIRPDADHVTSKGFACVKGIRFAAIHHDPDRLDTPLRRVDHPDGTRTFEPASWDEALAEIGASIARIHRRDGAHAVAMYLGNPSAFSAAHPIAAAAFMRSLGSRNLFTAGSQDCNNKFVVCEAMYGNPSLMPIPDLDHTRCLVLFGANPVMSQMTLVNAPRAANRLKAISERGGTVIVVDPRRTETAAIADVHHPIRPGTDVWLLAAFLREVLRRDPAHGGVDRARLEEVATGLGGLAELVEDWTPQRAEAATGIPAGDLLAMVDTFLAADGAVMYMSTGVNQSGSGTPAFWLMNVINAVSGNLDRRGGSVVATPLLSAARMIGLAGGPGQERSRIGGFRQVLDSMPGGVLADEILTPGESRIRALVVDSGNPVLSMPNGARLAEAFEDLELMVSIDIYPNETSRHAHWVLPATDFLERCDCTAVQTFGGLQPEPYVQYTPAVVPPAAERRDEWRILSDIAHAAGLAWMGSRAADLAVHLPHRLPLLGRLLALTNDRMVELMTLAAGAPPPVMVRRWPHGRLLRPIRPGRWLGSRRVPTDDHMVHLAPVELVAAFADLSNAEPTVPSPGPGGPAAALVLIGRRERHSHNTWTHNAEVFVSGRRTRNRMLMHPRDAAAAGVGDGELAEVASATGSVEVEVSVSDEVMPGVVSLPHGWGHRGAPGLGVASATAGVNSNLLAPDGAEHVERLSGMARLTGIPVSVLPAGRGTDRRPGAGAETAPA